MDELKLYAHALLNTLEGTKAVHLSLEDRLEKEGFEFEIDAIKNIMYFVVGKNNSHKLLDTMLAQGI